MLGDIGGNFARWPDTSTITATKYLLLYHVGPIFQSITRDPKGHILRLTMTICRSEGHDLRHTDRADDRLSGPRHRTRARNTHHAGDAADTIWTALCSTARARNDVRRAEREAVPLDGFIDGLGAVVTGHTILDDVAVTGNVWHINTGAMDANGHLTLARIDTDTFEPLTVHECGECGGC